MKGFPRLYAAASLKRRAIFLFREWRPRFSAALCRGLIEASFARGMTRRPEVFSAALCRGLIEAARAGMFTCLRANGFPRLYAAASLKHPPALDVEGRQAPFSAALCRGLIEARTRASGDICCAPFSAALCRGLIEAMCPGGRHPHPRRRFPRLYAAASLKPGLPACDPGLRAGFSAALCRGLIEAPSCTRLRSRSASRFPRLYAAASLKPARFCASVTADWSFSAALCRGLIEACVA